MALRQKDNQTRQIQAVLPPQMVESLRGARPGQTEVELVYLRHGQTVKQTIVVPRQLLYAMSDPGESTLKPLEAMESLRSFYKDVVQPGFQELKFSGEISTPASIVSQQIQHSYHTHAVMAGADVSVSHSLMLEDPEISMKLRSVASLLTGIPADKLREIPEEQSMVFVTRSVETVELKPQLRLRVQKIKCDCGSHIEEKEVSLPEGIDVTEAKTRTEQRMQRMPDIAKGLNDVYDGIAMKRGSVLTSEEKDAVVAHMNLKYVENPADRLLVTP